MAPCSATRTQRVHLEGERAHPLELAPSAKGLAPVAKVAQCVFVAGHGRSLIWTKLLAKAASCSALGRFAGVISAGPNCVDMSVSHDTSEKHPNASNE